MNWVDERIYLRLGYKNNSYFTAAMNLAA